MKFVDEAKIKVTAGKGGDGCLSFRREKYIPHGGPDGGDGGDGANIFLQASTSINTLVDFRYKRIFQGQNGQPGQGRLKTGASGKDLIIKVPCGTKVYDTETGLLLGDLSVDEELVLVACGGKHGLGNTRFKSATNRAPRKTTRGKLGEYKELNLELSLLADVGLLGLPNAGKSTLIRSVSNSKPKVADYPFTTLYPNLGVCRIESDRSFVIADIPGLVKGASSGTGMGIRFLKHLQRTTILLHIVDISCNSIPTVLHNIKDIIQELSTFSKELANKPQWIVLNKIDLVPKNFLEELILSVQKEFSPINKIIPISALQKDNTTTLKFSIMEYIENNKK
ncbi:MAG: GTPase ObgE [Legionellales bacterium]|nr:GTPase ObgE [Legionellales bacterium]